MSELLVDDNFIQDVVERYTDMIYRIAYQYTKNSKDAEDATQEIFLKLMRYGQAFEHYEHVKAWLIRVTINYCKDVKKSAWSRRVVPIETYDEHTIKTYDNTDKSLLEEVLGMQGKYRDVLYLYYYEGYTIAEISHILEASPNTISSRLQRGRKKLKILIKEDEANG